MTHTPDISSLPKDSTRTLAIQAAKALGKATLQVTVAVGVSVTVAVIAGTILQKIADGKAQPNTPAA